MQAVIVDDDDDMRAVIRLRLELSGVTVVADAADAATGVRAWLHRRPDVVIFDRQLAGVDGLDAIALVRRIDPAARVVLFSAGLDDAGRGRVAAAGVDFVRKPGFDDLLAAVLVDADAIAA